MSLILNHVVAYRGERYLFGPLSLQVSAGEMLTVTGTNGTGKSTLIAILAGLLAAHEGRVTFNNDQELSEYSHTLAHRDGLKTSLTAIENLQFSQAMMGNATLSPLDALTQVGLQHIAQLPVGYLSAGQRKRVAIARLLTVERPMWLLDEPTAALDDASHIILTRLMQQYLNKGGIIIAATHTTLNISQARVLNLESTLANFSEVSFADMESGQ